MTEAEVRQEELDRLVELVALSMCSSSLKKRVEKLLKEHRGRIRTPQEIRQMLSRKIKGSMAEEIIRMRQAE
jgi:hypothetical protein